MESNKANETLHKYLTGKSNPAEEIAIEQWYKRLLDSGEVNLSDRELEAVRSKMENRLMEAIVLTPKPKIYRLPKFVWAAASVVIVVTAGLFAYYNHDKIEPGTDKAILTLADGRKIELNKDAAGDLASQNGVSVRNQKGGWLEYFGSSKSAGMNTLSIPRGGQYRLILPDGTKVYLNSETVLEYPTAFNGKTRKLKLTGEAFFDVVHDKTHPFIVEVNGINVTVLGTSFNVMAYPNEKNIHTTVVTGLVGVSNLKQSVLVNPGQQATYKNGHALVISAADVDEVIAWKDGLFRFNGMKFSAIVQQLSRWYNVDFELQGKVPDEELYGIISRDEDISHVIEILEAAGHLHFETHNHTVTVTAVNTK